jgi:hypothetical protein
VVAPVVAAYERVSRSCEEGVRYRGNSLGAAEGLSLKPCIR